MSSFCLCVQSLLPFLPCSGLQEADPHGFFWGWLIKDIDWRSGGWAERTFGLFIPWAPPYQAASGWLHAPLKVQLLPRTLPSTVISLQAFVTLFPAWPRRGKHFSSYLLHSVFLKPTHTFVNSCFIKLSSKCPSWVCHWVSASILIVTSSQKESELPAWLHEWSILLQASRWVLDRAC